MGLLIKDDLITDIETARSRRDSRKLIECVDLMHKRLVEQVTLNAPVLDKDNDDRAGEVVDNFRQAWAYAQSNFPEFVDSTFIQEVAAKVEPTLCSPGSKLAPYRDGMATLDFGEGKLFVAPADSERIKVALNDVFKTVDDVSFHPVEEAVFYNLHLTRIQPFTNGNKRTANVVANTLLQQNGFFPIHLDNESASAYKGYLEGALRGFQSSSAQNGSLTALVSPDIYQKQYYEFLARRELNELLCAADRLKGLHSYKISLSASRDKGVLYAAKSSLRSWFSSRSLPFQVHIEPSKYQLEVYGDIPRHTLENVLGKVRRMGKFTLEDNGLH